MIKMTDFEGLWTKEAKQKGNLRELTPNQMKSWKRRILLTLLKCGLNATDAAYVAATPSRKQGIFFF
jgi:hypothetical protein